MDFLKALGIKIDPVHLVKQLATHASATFAAPVIAEYLLAHTNAAARIKLGAQLEAAGQAIAAGKVNDCAEQLGEIIDGVKF
jgi:hypothetical protein